jgi:hypothetical protein
MKKSCLYVRLYHTKPGLLKKKRSAPEACNYRAGDETDVRHPKSRGLQKWLGQIMLLNKECLQV